jgi:O-antigen/teichoic acid export membrane protein
MNDSKNKADPCHIHSSDAQAVKTTRNSLLLLLANATDMVFGLISVAVFARYLGIDLFGEYAFIMSMVMVSSTVSHFGLRRVIIRQVTKDKEKAGEYLGSVIIIRSAFSAVAFGAFIAAVNIVGLSEVLMKASYVLMVSEIFSIFGMAFMSIFFAFEKMSYNTLLTMARRIFAIMLILAVAHLDLGLILLMCSLLIPNVLYMFLGYVLVTRKFAKPRFVFDTEKLKYLIKESFPLFAELALRQGFLRAGVFILRAIRGAAEVSIFHAPYSLIIRLQMIPMAFTTALLPPMARNAVESMGTFKNTYTNAFKALLSLSLPIAVAVTILADKIVLIIFGKDFIQAASVLQILIWMVILMFPESLFNAVLVSIGKQWFSAVTHAVMFTINLGVDLILIPVYGFMGACIGAMSAYMSRFILSYLFISRNNITLPFGEIFPKPLLSAASMGVVMYLLRDFNIIATLSAGAVTYIVGILLTGTFSRDEMNTLRKSLYPRGRTKTAVPMEH